MNIKVTIKVQLFGVKHIKITKLKYVGCSAIKCMCES